MGYYSIVVWLHTIPYNKIMRNCMELSGILTVQAQCVCASRSALSLNKLLCRHFIHFIGAKLLLNSHLNILLYVSLFFLYL